MKSTSSNLRTSSAMTLSLSWANTLFFYRTKGKNRHTLSLWTMVFRLIPVMSSWLQAKKSRLFFRKRASSLRTEGVSLRQYKRFGLRCYHPRRSLLGLPLALLQPSFLRCSKLVSDLPFPTWQRNIREWPSSPFMLLLSRTLLRTLLADGMWRLPPSMH